MIIELAAFVAGAWTHKECSKRLLEAQLAQKWSITAGIMLSITMATAVLVHANSAGSLSEHSDALIWIVGGSFTLIQLLIGFIYLNGQKVIAEKSALDKQMLNDKLETDKKIFTDKLESDRRELLNAISSMKELATQMVNAVGQRVNSNEKDIENLYGLSGKIPDKYMTKEEHDKNCPRYQE